MEEVDLPPLTLLLVLHEAHLKFDDHSVIGPCGPLPRYTAAPDDECELLGQRLTDRLSSLELVAPMGDADVEKGVGPVELRQAVEVEGGRAGR